MKEWIEELQAFIDTETPLEKARRKQGISKLQFAFEVAEHLNKMRHIRYEGSQLLKVKVKK